MRIGNSYKLTGTCRRGPKILTERGCSLKCIYTKICILHLTNFQIRECYILLMVK